jgi:hypothetical protein
MELKIVCPCCGTEQNIKIELDAMRPELEREGWRKRKPMNLTPEERERRRRGVLDRLEAGTMGRGKPKGTPNGKERSDKGVRRGSMMRGSDF